MGDAHAPVYATDQLGDPAGDQPDPHAPAHHSVVAHHFEDLAQQRDALRLGLWVFLSTEVLFFGVLLTGYWVFRTAYPPVFREASSHLNVILGTLNTAILLGSSLAVALAVHAAAELSDKTGAAGKAAKRRQVTLLLLTTTLLGVIFLAIKGYEYYVDYEEGLIPSFNFLWEGAGGPVAELFFTLYFVTTGMHALHMIIGLFIAATMSFLVGRGWYDRDPMPIELFGLYWHFVDVVWIFVFPFYYLIGRT
jgi:cytochrome c oxidase subunit 3